MTAAEVGLKCDSVQHTTAAQSTGKLDILLVVDTSGSMSEELQRVSDQFSAVVDAIQGSFPYLDYRIATLLAHSSGNNVGKLWNPNGCAGPVLSGNVATDFNAEVKPELQCILNQFQQDPHPDHNGEAAFYSLMKATGPNLSSIRAQGFFRPDAALSVIFIADENEICHVPPDHTSNGSSSEDREMTYRAGSECDGMTPANVYQRLVSIQGGEPLTVGAAVDLRTWRRSYGLGYVGDPDTGFKGIVELAGEHGLKTSLSNSSSEMSQNLRELGEAAASGLAKVTRYSVPADLMQIHSVEMNGVPVQEYVFTPNSGYVDVPAAALGDAGDLIQINYCL